MSYKQKNYYNVFASKSHTHDDKYSELTHNHDDKYSKLTHNHDSTYLKVNSDIKVGKKINFSQNAGVIYGVDTSGNNIEALNTCGGSDALSLGYGGYKNSLGATKVFGNAIEINAKSGPISFNQQIKVPAGESGGVQFNNGDALTYNDLTNTYTFTADNSVDKSILAFSSALVSGKEAFKGVLSSVYSDNDSYFKLGNLMICYGSREISGFTSNTLVTHTVTLPQTFKYPPYVSLTINSGAPEKVSVGAGSVTATNFNINFIRTNATSTNIFWFAIGACA